MHTKNDHATQEDYFTYLPDRGLCETLGCTALSTGTTNSLPGAPYPPVRHPDDHHFIWEKGRTLQAYQFALISAGRGQFLAAPNPGKIHNVSAGDVILMFPGIWHRFAPDPEIGWVENWIECRGSTLDRIFNVGLMPLEAPIWSANGAANPVFATIHRLARENALLHQPTISMLALQLLAMFCQSRDQAEQGDAILIERARRALMETSGEPQALPSIARDLNLSYSSLRRLFRQHTGVSLKQYQTDVRIRRACELLRNSDNSIKEISRYLGYSSPFHFSAQFKKATDLSPSQWREKNKALL